MPSWTSGLLLFFQENSDSFLLGVSLTPSGVIILPKKSISVVLKWHFCHVIFEFVLREACVLPNLPIVCGCLVVAHLSVIPKICVISATIFEVNADLLSVMRVVGRYACFVMISINTLATFAGVA